jgi:trigger factor
VSENFKTDVTELEGSRARVEVVVPADEVDRAVQRAARKMAREMRMPGFRKGKAPPSLVIQRLGFPSVFEEAIRDALPEWYQRAVFESAVVPIGDPEIEVKETPDSEGQPLEFSFETGVRPSAELGEYLGLEVEKPATDVPSDLVDREVDRLREGMARLETVDRASEEGDHLLADFIGRIDGEEFEGGSASDQVIEIGAGRLIDDFEDQLKGVSAGGSVEVEVTFPDEYGAPDLAGKDAVFSVQVKEVREKILPEATDEFAAEASEFETIGELRADIESRIAEAFSERAEQDFRVAAIDAAVAGATVEVPDEILRARGQERWERVERQIAGQGMNPDSYLQMQGKTREEVIEESLPDAEQEIKREAVLVAVADAEAIEVSDEEMEAELEHMAGHERTTPAKLLERLKRDGRDTMIAADIRVRKAIDLIVESARPVPVAESGPAEGDESGEAGEAEGKLWTPGDPR